MLLFVGLQIPIIALLKTKHPKEKNFFNVESSTIRVGIKRSNDSCIQHTSIMTFPVLDDTTVHRLNQTT